MCALDAGQWLNHVHLLMAEFGANSANEDTFLDPQRPLAIAATRGGKRHGMPKFPRLAPPGTPYSPEWELSREHTGRSRSPSADFSSSLMPPRRR